jgi:hypothetical protein
MINSCLVTIGSENEAMAPTEHLGMGGKSALPVFFLEFSKFHLLFAKSLDRYLKAGALTDFAI